MLICLQCHLHSALFASGKLRPRLSKKHLLVSRYVHWINSPSEQAYNSIALRGKCKQTTNVFEPFPPRKKFCSGLYQFVIKTNDEMTNTMASNTLGNINSQQKKWEKAYNPWTCFNQRQLQLISFCFVLKALCFNSLVKPICCCDYFAHRLFQTIK